MMDQNTSLGDEAFLLIHFFYFSLQIGIMTLISVLIAFYNQIKLIQTVLYLLLPATLYSHLLKNKNM